MAPDSVCPCFMFGRGGAGAEDDGGEDRNPVVLVSGIGGSILHSRKKNKKGFQTRVWVRMLLADLEFKKKLWSLYNVDTGYTEQLEEDAEILVPDDDYGLYAIDILDPSLVVLFVKWIRLKEVYHFHDMIKMLVGVGYKKGSTLFGYGYDFRQSNRVDKHMEGFRAKLETAYKASGGRKVDIISHSMGGLLVSCFLALHSEAFAKYVNKWICIACPFQGAPGCINDSLLTGLQFVEGFESYFFVSRWTMHQLLVECPSIYEMLANPEFPWEQPPTVNVWQQESEDDDNSVDLKTYGPCEIVDLFQSALKNNELNYDGKRLPLPFNISIFQWAAETRHIINKAQLPSGVKFYNIYGTSFDTPFHVSYGSETSPIQDLSDICHTLPVYSCVDGDGTVPSESARADAFDAEERVGIAAGHRELLCNDSVFELIQNWLEVPTKAHKRRSRTSRVADSA
ncbi:hypothetical protein MLD38_015596 [Melastoma candidum]|uniref:Uncharacterized protein n=1 Tax=Melastoma candidum TaxID=119954 RepID=A0ACB9RIJ2_9MYRT|nr:hypothetical protein MLD38_015596 [Melastoma candidum]